MWPFSYISRGLRPGADGAPWLDSAALGASVAAEPDPAKANPMSLDAVLSRIDDDLPQALDRLMALLRIPSISTDPAYKAECARAADWVVDELHALGVDAEARATPGHPMVVGHHKGAGRHLLFYGHYDVQPVDPLHLWTRDPFDPAVEETARGQVIRARGAGDDKGQFMTFLEACRAWKAVLGTLPGNITFLFEGEEESGSPSLMCSIPDDHIDPRRSALFMARSVTRRCLAMTRPPSSPCCAGCWAKS